MSREKTGRGGRGTGMDAGPGGRARGMVTSARVTVLVLAVLAVVLIVENNRRIEIRLLIPVVTMPLYLALLIMAVLGAVCGALYPQLRRRR